MTKEEILEKLQKDSPTSIPVFKAMDEYAKSWRDRCLAAEDYIAKTPGDPDITERQIKAYEKMAKTCRGAYGRRR